MHLICGHLNGAPFSKLASLTQARQDQRQGQGQTQTETEVLPPPPPRLPPPPQQGASGQRSNQRQQQGNRQQSNQQQQQSDDAGEGRNADGGRRDQNKGRGRGGRDRCRQHVMAVALDPSTVVFALVCCDNIYGKHATILVASVST